MLLCGVGGNIKAVNREGPVKWWKQGRRWIVEGGWLDIVLRVHDKNVFIT